MKQFVQDYNFYVASSSNEISYSQVAGNNSFTSDIFRNYDFRDPIN